MQQPCYRCGAPVDDGTPFCRQCNAPQIKVVPAEPPAMEDVIETHPELARRPSEAQPPPRSRPIDWRTALPAIFFVAVPAGLLSFPPTILFLIWTFGAGALGVAGYRRRIQAPVTLGMAARLGLLS